MHKKIVEYFKTNVPRCQIAKALQISSSTVHNIIKRFRETGEISIAPFTVHVGPGKLPENCRSAFCVNANTSRD